MKKILVTGAAGFVGFHLVNRLIADGFEVIGIDNINDYYSPTLKYARLNKAGICNNEIVYNQFVDSQLYKGYKFKKINLEDENNIEELFKENQFDIVCHLAAQAGVRHSIENPRSYVQSNINGFLNILEGCRNVNIKHLVFASSSSVYGLNKKIPFSENDNTDYPISLYAATKKSGELMAYTYSHLFKIPTTGLRFFTVYGPWGRPDMAYFSFCKAICQGDPINVFNNGDLSRDFTYIDDIINGLSVLINKLPEKPLKDVNSVPYRLYNIGNNSPVKLLAFIETLESILGKKAKKNFLPMQPGDVETTFADIDLIKRDIGFEPKTKLENGLKEFVKWYIKTYN